MLLFQHIRRTDAWKSALPKELQPKGTIHLEDRPNHRAEFPLWIQTKKNERLWSRPSYETKQPTHSECCQKLTPYHQVSLSYDPVSMSHCINKNKRRQES